MLWIRAHPKHCLREVVFLFNVFLLWTSFIQSEKTSLWTGMLLITCELRNQEKMFFELSFQVHVCGIQFLTKNMILNLSQTGPQLFTIRIPISLVVWKVWGCCKKWMRNNSQKGVAFSTIRREACHCDWSACYLDLERGIGITMEKCFLCICFQKHRPCCSFVLGVVTRLLWGEPSVAFKFRRTTAFCLLKSSQAWPKTEKGCLAWAFCQRFNIWILL